MLRKFSGGKPERKRPLSRCRNAWEDNTGVHKKET
jgi:hypothetical protein